MKIHYKSSVAGDLEGCSADLRARILAGVENELRKMCERTPPYGDESARLFNCEAAGCRVVCARVGADLVALRISLRGSGD